jgi:hypothetical protein
LTGLVTAIALALVGATLYLGLAGVLGMNPVALAPDAPQSGTTATRTAATVTSGRATPTSPLPTPAIRATPAGRSASKATPGTGGPAPSGNGGARPTAPPPVAATAAPAAPDEVALATVTEDDLHSALQRSLAARGDGPSLEETRVRVAGGRIIVQGKTTGLPIALNVTITGRAEVRDGRPRIVVSDVASEGFPLPDFLRDELQRQVDQLNLTPLPEGIEITRIEHGDGVVTIYGRRR